MGNIKFGRKAVGVALIAASFLSGTASFASSNGGVSSTQSNIYILLQNKELKDFGIKIDKDKKCYIGAMNKALTFTYSNVSEKRIVAYSIARMKVISDLNGCNKPKLDAAWKRFLNTLTADKDGTEI